MFSLNFTVNDKLYFKDIKIADLSRILSWYNGIEDSKYATGICTPMSLEALTQKYAEVAICGSEFFSGIYLKSDDTMIGILKGSIRYRSRDAVWISSIVIDPCFRKRGYGTMAVEMLLNCLEKCIGIKSAYIAVFEDNMEGRNFWFRQNFQVLRRSKSQLAFQGETHNILIMYRRL